MSTEPSLTESSWIDAHLHLKAPSALDDLAAAGIAAVRDAGTRDGVGLEIQRMQRSGGPVVRTAGRALVKAGGYGALLGRPLGSPEEMRREIAELADAGVDIIKVVASGVVSITRAGAVTAGGFSADELKAAAAFAAERGLSVMCHANGPDAISSAVAAGVRSIEHGFFITEDLLRAMADSGTFWVPTVGALRRAAAGADAAQQIAVAGIIDRHLEMLGRAHALGVPLAVGTDCVLPDRRYGGYYRDELQYFRAAGIPADAVELIAREGGRRLLCLV